MNSASLPTRELELAVNLGQQLLGIEDFQPGLWNDEMPRKLSNLRAAQIQYAELISALLPDPNRNASQLLEINCGTGFVLEQLAQFGFKVHGLVGSEALAKLARIRLADNSDSDTRVFGHSFEQFPVNEHEQYYDAVIINNSFERISLADNLNALKRLIKPGGLLLVMDYFAEQHDLFQGINTDAFTVVRNDDLTENILPNLKLLDQFLTYQLKPASMSLQKYLFDTSTLAANCLNWFIGKKLKKLNQLLSTSHYQQALDQGLRFRSVVLQLVKPI